MTDRRPEPELDLSRVAAQVLAEAVEAARRDAVAELRSRIAGQLVRAAEESLESARPDRQPTGQQSGDGEGDRPGAAVMAAGAGAGRPGWYLYGITWGQVAVGLPSMAGVGGHPVEVVPVGRLAMAGSWLAEGPAEWGIDGPGDADLDRLAPLVRAHEGVLEALLDRGPVLPLRFGQLYPDADRLRDLVERREDAVAAALQRLDGRAEWGLTLDWDPREDDRDPGAEPAAGGGERYLARRRDQMTAAGQAARAARVEAGRVHDALAAIADGHVVHPLRRHSRGSRPVVWRASYLVGDRQVDAFRQAAAARLDDAPAELGLGGQLTGPWPAYNFADLDLEQVPA